MPRKTKTVTKTTPTTTPEPTEEPTPEPTEESTERPPIDENEPVPGGYLYPGWRRDVVPTDEETV